MSIYVYEDVSWHDRDSGLDFEAYNLMEYPSHVEEFVDSYTSTETSLHDVFCSVLLMESEVEWVEGGNPYFSFTLQELMDVSKRIGIKLRMVGEDYD